MSSSRSLLNRSAVAAVSLTALLSLGAVGFLSYAEAASPGIPGGRVIALPTLPIPTGSASDTGTASGTPTATGTSTGTASTTASTTATASPTPTVTSTDTSTDTATATPSPTFNPTENGPQDTAPVAEAKIKPQLTYTGTVITLSSMGSADNETPAGQLKYRWNFDNGGTTVDSTKANVTFTPIAKKIYKISLTVIDPQGLRDVTTTPVTVYKRVDCQSSGVTKVGPWRVKTGAGFGGKYCDNLGDGTHGQPDTVTVSFTSNLFRIDYGIAHGGGKGMLFIDGKMVKTFSFGGKANVPKFGKKVVIRNLTTGKHTARLEIKGGAFLDHFCY